MKGLKCPKCGADAYLTRTEYVLASTVYNPKTGEWDCDNKDPGPTIRTSCVHCHECGTEWHYVVLKDVLERYEVTEVEDILRDAIQALIDEKDSDEQRAKLRKIGDTIVLLANDILERTKARPGSFDEWWVNNAHRVIAKGRVVDGSRMVWDAAKGDKS